MTGAFSIWHWLILIGVLILLFGAKRLPEAARSLGKSMRIFKSEVKEMQNDGKQEQVTPPPPTPVQSERVAEAEPQPNHTDARPA